MPARKTVEVGNAVSGSKAAPEVTRFSELASEIEEPEKIDDS